MDQTIDSSPPVRAALWRDAIALKGHGSWSLDDKRRGDETAAAASDLPVEQAVVTQAPKVPPPITWRTEAKEVVKRMDDGVDCTFWTVRRLGAGMRRLTG